MGNHKTGMLLLRQEKKYVVDDKAIQNTAAELDKAAELDITVESRARQKKQLR